jgi:hypothetical protein
MGEWRYRSAFLDLSVTPRPLYFLGNRLDVSQSRSSRCGEEKNLALSTFEPRPVAMPTCGQSAGCSPDDQTRDLPMLKTSDVNFCANASPSSSNQMNGNLGQVSLIEAALVCRGSLIIAWFVAPRCAVKRRHRNRREPDELLRRSLNFKWTDTEFRKSELSSLPEP